MTEEKFDGTIGRCASVVAIVQLIMFIVKNAKGNVALSEFLWCIAEVFVAVFALFLVFCFFSQRRKGKLDSAAKRATLVDYKYCSDVSATGISQLLCDRYKIDIENLSGSVVILKDRKEYLSSKQFFENESIMSGFECIPLKNEDKKNKCILQVLYIPIDKDENVPVILRMPDQHSTASEDNPEFTFISFSPVPRRYGAQFDKLDCYKREVPSDYESIDIDEYGTALSKQGSVYYLFYIFFARYNCQFLKDGKMDYEVLKNVFSDGNGKMFAKDHDKILHATSFKKLYKAVNGQRPDDAILIDIMKGKRKIGTFNFDLSNARFKGVENKIVELKGQSTS